MPHSYGYRARTRDMFAVPFRKNGVIALNTYMRCWKVGDYVDVKASGKIQKGMPHKIYHGRTGVIYNVTNSSVGVICNKLVNGRQMKKRINIRVEHVHHSKCRDEIISRVKANEAIKEAWRKGGKKPEEFKNLKRVNRQPEKGGIVKVNEASKPKIFYPKAYEFIV